ncbi:AAA family ATPase [bacterium]|nr:AAA family ATPase [bacterium]
MSDQSLQLPANLFQELEGTFPGLDKENPEFLRALYFLEKSSRSLFITGKAGTGKSTLVKLFTRHTKKKVLILAPSGISAINAGGQTIHSFFGFPLRPILPGDKEIRRFKRDSYQADVAKNVDTIIIDEISMVRADLLDAIHFSLSLNTGVKNVAFGGKQIVFIGDPFQLPPVVKDDEREVISYLFPSPYFFDAMAFSRRYIEMIELQKVYRQKDPTFLGILNKIRLNNCGDEDVAVLNTRYYPYYEPADKDYIITLCTTNKTADTINKNRLNKLQGDAFVYTGTVEGDFPKGSLPTDVELELKVGAQIIFIRNDFQNRWVNGTLAKVTRLEASTIEVVLENGELHELEAHEWENKKYKWDLKKGKIEQEVLGTFTQFPIKLAWAITIHKSQGLTFDRAIIDIGRGTFAHGQLYVALSRCRSLKGLALRQKISPREIIVDKVVSTAYHRGFLGEGSLKLY